MRGEKQNPQKSTWHKVQHENTSTTRILDDENAAANAAANDDGDSTSFEANQ